MRELHRIKIKKKHGSIIQRDSSLFVYSVRSYCYKNSNQKHLQSGTQTKNMERNYKTEKWEIKKELVNEQIRELNNWVSIQAVIILLKKRADRENLVTL